MYASFNRFDHNVYRDATIVTTLDTFTSMLAGCTIFGILGHLAHESGTTNIGEVVEAGAGLAFISYPDAIAKFKFLPQVSLSGKSFFHRLVADSIFCVFNSSQYAGFRRFPYIDKWKEVNNTVEGTSIFTENRNVQPTCVDRMRSYPLFG